jgi:serine/threonine-protein kinase
MGCGKQFIPNAPDRNLCPKCAEDKGKVFEAIVRQVLGAACEKHEKGGSAIPEGFRKVKRLGAGGMGEVWLVQEEKTGKKFALKTMLPQVAADERAKKSFLREARLGEVLEHKNVIRVYKTGCESDMFFILMELCEGGSVDNYMERCGGKLPLDIATYIILQALDGLEYAHHAEVSVECEDGIRRAKGVVHRDFKPGNIFLMDNGKYPVVKVADFGFAKAFETAGLSRHTRTGTAAATPVFQPRQQIANYKYSKPEVDVWAAAASYYNMLTGSFPKDIRGKDIWLEMYTGTPVPIRQRDSRIPEKLASVIDYALVERPEIGIKTAAELKSQIVKSLPMNIRHAVRGVL